MISLKGIDKSIITYFDSTPEGIVCPHFYEFKWANGCMFSCAWCYLQGTFRYPRYEKHGSHPNPLVKDRARVENALLKFLNRAREHPKENFLLNSGELSDSLITSGEYTLVELITDIEEWPENVKVLFLTKSNRVPDTHENSRFWNGELKQLIETLKKRSIMSWSLNAYDVAKKWEKGGAPHPYDRIDVAKQWHDHGFNIRFRIDPIVPVKYWQHKYFQLIDDIFNFFKPAEVDRITLGTLRGLQSTINAASELSWLSYLSEKTSWGLKMPEKIRYQVYSDICEYLKKEYEYDRIAICKETEDMIAKLYNNNMIKSYKSNLCNCLW